MSVPKGRRSQSKFEAHHHFYWLRDEVTKLILNDFGFSEYKYQKALEKYRVSHSTSENLEDVVERWETKTQSFRRWFIDEEGKAILDILRDIQRNFTMANSIYPSETHAKLLEFLTRRFYMNKAIGLCYSLKQEVQYVIRTLPVDINKYERFAIEIDKQIALYKGVRLADNRLIKPKKGTKHESLSDCISKTFDGIASIIRKIGRIEQDAEDEEQGNL